MTIDTAILKNEEKISFALRSLYHSRDYRPYRMSKFEEYELYVKNKDFLRSPEVITFTDLNGKEFQSFLFGDFFFCVCQKS